MSKILKNYIKNFLKSWAETFGFLVFIILLFCSLFGIVSSPMQLYIKETNIKLNSKNPDYVVNLANSSNKGKYIAINYLYQGDTSIFGKGFTGDYSGLFFSDDFYRSIFIDTYLNYNKFKDYDKEDSKNTSEVNAIINYYDDQYAKTNKPIVLNDSNIYDLSNWDNDDYTTFNWDTKLSDSDKDDFYIYLQSYINSFLNDASKYNEKVSIYTPSENKDGGFTLDKMDIDDCIAPNCPILNNFRNEKYLSNFDIYFVSKLIEQYQEKNSQDDFNINYELSWSYSTKSVLSSTNSWNIKVISQDSSNDSIFYPTKNKRYDTDQLVITKGRKAKYNKNSQEIVLSESFAKKNNIKIGDTFTMDYGSWSNNEFKVVGFGDKYDYLSPINYNPFEDDSSSSGYVYLPTQLMSEIYNKQNAGDATKNNISGLNYKLQIKNNKKNDVQKLFTYNDIYYFGSSEDYNSLNYWDDPITDYTQTKNYQTVQNQNIQILVYFLLMVGIMSLSILFINFIIKKELNQTRKQIGIFKSIGYKTSELAWVFTIKEYINMLIGTIIGWLLSFPLQIFVAKSWQKQTALYIQPICTNYIYLLVILALVPIIIALVSFILNYLYLKENIISLINNPRKVKAIKKIKNKKNSKSNMKLFSFKLMHSFTKQSLAKFIVVNVLLFLISLTTFLELTALNLLEQTINSEYLQYNDDYQTSFSLASNSIVPLKIDDNNKLYVQTSDKTQTEFIDYSDYDSTSGDPIEKYIKDNDSTSLVFCNNIKNIIQILAAEIKSNPSSLYIPNNIQSIISGALKPLIIPLLFSDYTSSDLNYQSMTYNNLYEKSFTRAEKLISDIASGDDISLEKTFFSVCPINDDGQYSSIHLKDIVRIFAIFENSSQISDYVGENKLDTNDTDVLKQTLNNNFSNKININDQSKWSQYIQLSNYNSNSSTNLLSSGIGSTISLSQNITSLLFAACSSLKEDNYDPLINFDQVYFNSKKEMLNYSLGINSKLFPTKLKLNLCDFRSLYTKDEFNLGDPSYTYNLKGITLDQEKKLSKMNSDGSINILISKVSAKYNNYKIGDEFSTPISKNLTIKMKIVGIINSMTFTHQMFADYKTFFYNYGDNILNYDSQKDYYSIANDDKVYSNSFANIPLSKLYSQNYLYKGSVSYENIANDVRNLNFVYPSISASVSPDSSIFFSMFNSQLQKISNFSDFLESVNLNSDSSFSLITNPNILSSSSTKINTESTNTVSLGMQKSLINELSNKITIIIYLLIALSIVLITIILLLVVNIIIDESIQIILTLKSIGYKKREINLIILGSYIIAGAIIFMTSWLANILVWSIALKIIWTKSQVLLTSPISYSSILINFTIITIILSLGYMTCAYKNNKLLVTQVIE